MSNNCFNLFTRAMLQEIEEGLKQCRPEMKWMEMNFTLSLTDTLVWEYEVSWRRTFAKIEGSQSRRGPLLY